MQQLVAVEWKKYIYLYRENNEIKKNVKLNTVRQNKSIKSSNITRDKPLKLKNNEILKFILLKTINLSQKW